MTNAEKFKEVFGAIPTIAHCPILYREDCKKCKGYCNSLGCRGSDWWNSEYKEEVPEIEAKGCFNCKNKERKITEEPCFSCNGYLSRWEDIQNGKS